MRGILVQFEYRGQNVPFPKSVLFIGSLLRYNGKTQAQGKLFFFFLVRTKPYFCLWRASKMLSDQQGQDFSDTE